MQVRNSYGTVESCCECVEYEEGYNGGGDGYRCCGWCGHALTQHHVTRRGEDGAGACDICHGRGYYEQFGPVFSVPLPCPKCDRQ